jgi:glycosyltransferase involved in cell wall biosynthesis
MNDALPKVAILAQGAEPYGVGQVALTLATELQRRGGQPQMIVTQEGALTEQCQAEGIACHHVDLPPWPRFQRSKWKSLVALARQRLWMRGAAQILAARLRELSADCLVVQWPAHVELAGQACRRAGIACHWVIANVISDRWPLGLNRRYYRYLCRHLAITPFPNSRYTARTLGGGADASVLYLGVDEKRFTPDRMDAVTRAELGLSPGVCVVGMFARVEPSKGQALVWRAMLELIAEEHDLHLLVVGGPTEGEEANELRNLANAANAASRLHFVGWAEEPARYYGAVDLVANATTIAEGFGLSVVEAMMMGRPVLVHALGGPAETVEDGVTGWHVSTATVEALTAGLRRALRDRPRWQRMGQAARQRALDHFSAAAFVSNYLRLSANSKRELGGTP